MEGPGRRAMELPKVAIAFKPEYLDFRRGIRVGNLEPNERITRILKLELESRYRQDFVTERWGRGVFWRWIGYLPRANRSAKPISGKVSFGCSKFFLSVDTGDRVFQCGLQVERGYVKARPDFPQCQLQADWDWHRLKAALTASSPMERELKRLVTREGFRLFAGSWENESSEISKESFKGAAQVRKLLRSASGESWAGFQLYYPFSESEVRGMTGLELVESMMAVFREVTPAMNLCMQIRLAV